MQCRSCAKPRGDACHSPWTGKCSRILQRSLAEGSIALQRRNFGVCHETASGSRWLMATLSPCRAVWLSTCSFTRRQCDEYAVCALLVQRASSKELLSHFLSAKSPANHPFHSRVIFPSGRVTTSTSTSSTNSNNSSNNNSKAIFAQGVFLSGLPLSCKLCDSGLPLSCKLCDSGLPLSCKLCECVQRAIGIVCKCELSRGLTSPGIASATDEMVEKKHLMLQVDETTPLPSSWTGGQEQGSCCPPGLRHLRAHHPRNARKSGHGRYGCGVRTCERSVSLVRCRCTGQIAARSLRPPSTCATVSCTHGPARKVCARLCAVSRSRGSSAPHWRRRKESSYRLSRVTRNLWWVDLPAFVHLGLTMQTLLGEAPDLAVSCNLMLSALSTACRGNVCWKECGKLFPHSLNWAASIWLMRESTAVLTSASGEPHVCTSLTKVTRCRFSCSRWASRCAASSVSSGSCVRKRKKAGSTPRPMAMVSFLDDITLAIGPPLAAQVRQVVTEELHCKQWVWKTTISSRVCS